MEIVGFLYRMAAVAAFMVVAFVLISYYWTKRSPEQHQRFKEALKYAMKDTGRKLPCNNPGNGHRLLDTGGDPVILVLAL